LAGDTTAAEAVIDHAYENPSWTREFIHASLTLCHAMAQRLHRPAGMLLLYQAITNARDAPHLHQRLAAQLILGHAEIQPTLDASGTITAAETHAELFNCGAELVNDAITASGDRFDETLLAALKLWVQLLPEPPRLGGSG
jgi:hypothetical protein